MFAVTFIYVCLKVANFSLVFALGFIEPIGYGVCYMDVGCWDGFIVGGSFIC